MIDTSKLDLSISETKRNLILLLHGSFNPIQNRHLRLLEFARQHLLSLDKYHILGGYLSPIHNINIQQKLANVPITWQDRLAMCRLAVQDSSWIMVDHWQISEEINHNIQQSHERFKNVFANICSSIQIVPICGSDVLLKFKSLFKKGLVICIRNRSIENVDVHHQNILHLDDDDQSIEYLSNHSIREQINRNLFENLIAHLHPLIIEYHRKNRLRYCPSNQSIFWSEFQDNNSIELGQGRCAIVYQKEYQNQLVAVKVIRERKQFQIESLVVTLLSEPSSYHRNLIRIYGLGDQFYVMEKCDMSLLSYIQLNRIHMNQTIEDIFPNNEYMELIKQMLNGFCHLISIGILHRDIKTDNILLSSNRIVKISDFSVSINRNLPSNKMPARGSIRHYAPESIQDKQIYTEKSDVYMFGCLLYEIVHGCQLIWNEQSTFEVVQRRLNGDKPLFSNPCQSWYIDLVFSNCWTMNPNDRSTFENLFEKHFL